MSKQNPLDFETMVDQVLEAKAQKGQITKAAKQFGLRPKQIKDALASIDPSGRSSYGDWLIKMWMKGDIDPTKDADRIKEVMRAWHELKKRAFLPDKFAVLTSRKYPDFETLVKVVREYMLRLPKEFQVQGEEEERVAPGREFIATHYTDYEEAKDYLNRPVWSRRDHPPAARPRYLGGTIHSDREGSWCIRNPEYFSSELDEEGGFIGVMKYEPDMVKPNVVPDPIDTIRRYEAGELGSEDVPYWVEDEDLRQYAVDKHGGGYLVKDELPYTTIYLAQIVRGHVVLWDNNDKPYAATEDISSSPASSPEPAEPFMASFGSVSEQLNAMRGAVADASPEVRQAVENFINMVYVSPEVEERMAEYSDVLDGRKVNLDDLMKQRAGVNKVTRVANLRDFTQRFSEVPGVEVFGDEDDPTILVHVNVQDQGVWDYLARIATGESMAPDIEKEVMREIMLSKFINEYLNPNKPDTYFGQHAYDKFHRIEQEQGAVPGQVTIVKANKEWGQLPGIESEQKWKAIFERAMQRLGATWNFNPKDNTLTLEGATFKDIIDELEIEDLWYVYDPQAEVPRIQIKRQQQQQLLPPFQYKYKNEEPPQYQLATALENTQFERLVEKKVRKDKSKAAGKKAAGKKGAEKKDSKKKKADKRTEEEKDRQSNIYQWFAGLPMRPMPEKADFKRSLEFFGKHAFSNKVKVAEVNKKKKFAKLVSEQTSDVNPDDVAFLRRHLLARGFRVKPVKPWPGGEYVRMKLFRIGQDLLAPIAPEATPFLPPEAGEHFKHLVPQESFEGAVERLMEKVPMFKGEPRIGPRAGDSFVDAVDLELQHMTGMTLGTWIDWLGQQGVTPKAVMLGLDYAFRQGYSSAETATYLVSRATKGFGSSTTMPFGENKPQFDRLVEKALGLAAQEGIGVNDVDPEELRMGIKVEKEHGGSESDWIRIALDHLTEDPKYYSKGKAKGFFHELTGEDSHERVRGPEVEEETDMGDPANFSEESWTESLLDEAGPTGSDLMYRHFNPDCWKCGKKLDHKDMASGKCQQCFSDISGEPRFPHRKPKWNPKASGKGRRIDVTTRPKTAWESSMKDFEGLVEESQCNDLIESLSKAQRVLVIEELLEFRQERPGQQYGTGPRQRQMPTITPPARGPNAQQQQQPQQQQGQLNDRERTVLGWYMAASGKGGSVDAYPPQEQVEWFNDAGRLKGIVSALAQERWFPKVMSILFPDDRARYAFLADKVRGISRGANKAVAPGGERPPARGAFQAPRRESVEKKSGKLYEFSTPERQSAILWARGVPVSRNNPKTPMWFQENEAYALWDKIAEVDRETKSAKVLSPKVTSALTGRQIKIVENALRCTQFAVEFVEGW